MYIYTYICIYEYIHIHLYIHTQNRHLYETKETCVLDKRDPYKYITKRNYSNAKTSATCITKRDLCTRQKRAIPINI